MIIRMTLNDNDFTEKLEKFSLNLNSRIYYGKTLNIKDAGEYRIACKEQEKIQKWFNIDNRYEFTENDERILRSCIYEEWCEYVDKMDILDDVKKYLKDHFTVSIRFCFDEKWENGEVVYHFTANDSYITQ